MSELARFMAKVAVPIAGSNCWKWIGAKKRSGYGNFYMHGKYLGAHRASFVLFRGDIPASTYICHSCDNPSCVNPDHLFVGTPKQNQEDMTRKGRDTRKKGAGHYLSKLDDDKVVEIRLRREHGDSLKDIASAYDVSEATISLVARRKIWKHVK